VLLTDGFGIVVDNPKILADGFAKKLNMDVWVPDTFNGKIAVELSRSTLSQTDPRAAHSRSTISEQPYT
jgi:carboxymethylenebutenolidase